MSVFEIYSFASIKVVRVPTGQELDLHGADADSFMDELEKAQDAAPDVPQDELIARLWVQYS